MREGIKGYFVYHLCTKNKKEPDRNGTDSLGIDWRPQRDLNPRYRRESRKILKHQTVVVVRVSRFSFRFKRLASYSIYGYYDDFVFSAKFYHIFITVKLSPVIAVSQR